MEKWLDPWAVCRNVAPASSISIYGDGMLKARNKFSDNPQAKIDRGFWSYNLASIAGSCVAVSLGGVAYINYPLNNTVGVFLFTGVVPLTPGDFTVDDWVSFDGTLLGWSFLPPAANPAAISIDLGAAGVLAVNTALAGAKKIAFVTRTQYDYSNVPNFNGDNMYWGLPQLTVITPSDKPPVAISRNVPCIMVKN